MPQDGDVSTYDVIVIGAGSTGENVAARAVQGGLTAVVIENELVGGDCSYWACMPSKALLRGPELLETARHVDGVAQAITGTVDVAATLARRDRFAKNWQDDSQVDWLGSAGIDLVRGSARLAGPRRVRLVAPDGARQMLTARQAVVICTGSAAAVPPVPGLAESAAWTGRDATSAQHVPRRLAVLGGGVVACEMATAFLALGAERVTLLERAERLLAGMEPFASELVAAALRQRGAHIRTGVSLQGVQRPEPGGPVTLDLGEGAVLVADELLIATGRAPRTADLGLETVGIEPGSWLDVDESCRVTAVDEGWLYAAGDVNHRALLTHMGKYQARACGEAIAARAKGDPAAASPAEWSRYAASADHAAVPQVMFTDPQVASVGLTEQQARDAGHPVRAVEYEIGNVAGAALYQDGYTGRAKLVVDHERRVVLGATFVGPGVDNLLHAGTVAVVGEVPLDRLWHAVPSYPTMSEIWLRLLETYGL